jgi:heptosyltransferase-2
MSRAASSSPRTIPQGAVWMRVPRFIGDAMMIHAATAPLRAAGVPVVAWGPAWVVDLFDGAEGYAAIRPEPKRKYSPLAAAFDLMDHAPAAVINFPKSQRPALAAFLARVPVRVGCSEAAGRLFYTHHKPFWTVPGHFVDRYAAMLDGAFQELPAEAPFAPFRPRASALASVEAHPMGRRPFAVLLPGANAANKRISAKVLGELALHLDRNGLLPVILGGAGDDQALAEGIRATAPGALDLTGRLGLAESAAWISRAAVAVGADSGLSHVAALSGVPTVMAYGPTRPELSAPRGPRVLTVQAPGLSCLGCMGPSCPLYADALPCMEGITALQLRQAIDAMLASSMGEGAASGPCFPVLIPPPFALPGLAEARP